jgi:hypothetical protein
MMFCCYRALYFFAFSFTFNTTTALLAICICLISGQSLPLLRAILSNCAPPHMQAKVAMAFGALQSVVTLLSSLATLIYSASLEINPAMIYWIFAGSCTLGIVVVAQPLFNPYVRCNLPDLNGVLPPERMGFADKLEPLLVDTKEGRSRSSVDRFKEGLRINSGAADLYISSVVPTLDVAVSMSNAGSEEDDAENEARNADMIGDPAITGDTESAALMASVNGIRSDDTTSSRTVLLYRRL